MFTVFVSTVISTEWTIHQQQSKLHSKKYQTNRETQGVLKEYKMLQNPQSPKLSQIINLNFGLFGIQFAWILVTINISGIFSFFGATPSKLASFWLVPSLIGVVLPPIVGILSDKTNTAFGKRIPYIFSGALITAICMYLLPGSVSLSMAIILFSLFIAAINTSLQPYRPLVTDVVPPKLHTKLYAIQAGIIGLGALFASGAPWLLLHLTAHAHSVGQIPVEIRYALYLGAILIFITVAWSALKGKKYLAAIKTVGVKDKNVSTVSFLARFKAIPKLMWQISYVQMLTWLGTFCFLVYLTPTIEQIIFHVSPTVHAVHSKQYLEDSVIITDIASVIYMLVNVVFAYCIPFLSNQFTRKKIHIFSLAIGGIALIAVGFIHTANYLFIAMIGVGMAWASFNSIPFAMFASVVPADKSGWFLGMFNIAICIPQILGSLFVGLLLQDVLHDHAVYIIILAGLCYLLAAFLTVPIKDEPFL